MRTQFDRLCNKIDGLGARERIAVFAAGVTLIGLSWYLLFGEPEIGNYERLLAQRAGVELQLADRSAVLAQQASQRQTAGDPRQRLAAIEQRAAGIDEQIDDYAAELISPTDMARLLERVLQRRPVLDLRSLRNLGAEDLLPEDAPGTQRLYRHGLVMELEGPYLAVLAYLEDIELLPWRLYWHVLEIDVTEYPVNRVRIEVATLSLHEEWIGV